MRKNDNVGDIIKTQYMEYEKAKKGEYVSYVFIDVGSGKSKRQIKYVYAKRK